MRCGKLRDQVVNGSRRIILVLQEGFNGGRF